MPSKIDAKVPEVANALFFLKIKKPPNSVTEETDRRCT